MKVRYTLPALSDLAEILDCLARRNTQTDEVTQSVEQLPQLVVALGRFLAHQRQ